MPIISRDCAIIGGGPAGAAAAILLARAGRDVCLFERKHGDHDKVCGEFISWDAVACLQQLGIDISDLGALPITHARICNGADVLETTLPFTAWSLSRRRLDAALLQVAGREGARLRHGEAVQSLERRQNRWRYTTSRNNTAFANTVFLASGKQDLRGWRRAPATRNNRMLGFKMHLEAKASQYQRLRSCVELYLFDEGYAGLEPVEDGKFNLCFLVDKAVYQACGNRWSALLAWLGKRCPHLNKHLSHLDCLWPRPLAVYGTPYGFLHAETEAVPNLFRLGDQFAVIPSFAGDGIGIALQTAQLAAATAINNGTTSDYQRAATARVRGPLRDAGIASMVASHGATRHLALNIARHFPSSLSQMIQRVRLRPPHDLVAARVSGYTPPPPR